MKTIIALTGRNGVGKDYLASAILGKLKDVPGLTSKSIAFSSAIKETTHQLFDWLPTNAMNDPLLKNNSWVHSRNPYNLTPRVVIQTVDVLRTVDPYMFTRQTLKDINTFLSDKTVGNDKVLIVTDLRMPHEQDALKMIASPDCMVHVVKLVDGKPSTTDKFDLIVDANHNYDFLIKNEHNGPDLLLKAVFNLMLAKYL